MKKSTIYSSILLLVIATASCGKGTDAGSSSQKITSYTEDVTAIGGHSVQTYNVNYDEQGRITSIASTNKFGLRIVYKYSAENSFTYDKYADTVHLIHSIYFLNSQSLIDSTWGHDFKSYGYKPDTSSAKFIYDADKKLMKQKQYLNSYLLPPVLYNTVSYQYDLNGALVKEGDQGYYETSYAYDKELKNTVQLEPSYFPVKASLPSHTFTTQSGGRSYETKHTYTFDDHKRVMSEKQERNDGQIIIKTYTYER